MTTGGFPAQTITTETAEKLSRTKEPLDIHDSDVSNNTLAIPTYIPQ